MCSRESELFTLREVHPGTGNQLHDDRVPAVRIEPDLHREFFLERC